MGVLSRELTDDVGADDQPCQAILLFGFNLIFINRIYANEHTWLSGGGFQACKVFVT